VVDAGKLLQLVEELGSAAVLPVAALTLCAIVSAVLAAVGDVLHAEAAVDLPAVVVPETLQIVRAIVVRLASLFPVFLGNGSIVSPWVADVLETSEACSLHRAITIVDARLERRLLGRCERLVVQTTQLFVHFPGGSGHQEDQGG